MPSPRSKPPLFHPKCGEYFPDTSLTGHCGGCCLTFYGLTAFENHQSHVDGKVVCTHPRDDTRVWRLDAENRWRFGEGMSTERRNKLEAAKL